VPRLVVRSAPATVFVAFYALVVTGCSNFAHAMVVGASAAKRIGGPKALGELRLL